MTLGIAGEETMSTARRYLPHYTRADYEQWEGNWELWQGIPIATGPSPFGPHQALAAKLVSLLVFAVESANCEAVVMYEIDWIISDDTVVRPDIVVICGEVPEGHVTQAPALIVEILSPSTAGRDRNQKLGLYQDHGVEYYLIVDPNDHVIEAYRRNDQGRFERIEAANNYEFTLCNDCRIPLDVGSIF
jgi:Uma2 family endonuclease